MISITERIKAHNIKAPDYCKISTDFINDNIPAKFHDKELSNFVGFNLLKIDLDKVLKLEQSLYIYGTNGSGKTHLSYALKKEIEYYYQLNYKEPELKIIIINDRDFFQELQADFNLLSGYKSSILKADVVIWEEWGKTKPSVFTSSVLAAIINRVADNLKPILICNTTIAPGKDGSIIKSRFEDGADIYSRMKDIFKNGFIEIESEDWRG